MTLTSTMAKACVALVAGVGTAAAAVLPTQAFTISAGSPLSSGLINFSSFTPTAGAIPSAANTVNGFTDGIATYGATPTSDGVVVSGNRANVYAAPTGSTGPYLTIGSLAPRPADVDITFNKLMDGFGLLWGSIDTFNSITFFTQGAGAITYTGTQVGAALGITPNGRTTSYVTFNAENADQFFTGVRLASSGVAFESDNHSYRIVPTPALLPGLIGMGVAALRRKKDETAEETA